MRKASRGVTRRRRPRRWPVRRSRVPADSTTTTARSKPGVSSRSRSQSLRVAEHQAELRVAPLVDAAAEVDHRSARFGTASQFDPLAAELAFRGDAPGAAILPKSLALHPLRAVRQVVDEDGIRLPDHF